MTKFTDILTFRTMISPAVLQVLFWGGIGGVLYGTYVLFILDNWAWPLSLIFGTLLVRVLFERAILSFRTYDLMVDIRDALKEQTKA